MPVESSLVSQLKNPCFFKKQGESSLEYMFIVEKKVVSAGLSRKVGTSDRRSSGLETKSNLTSFHRMRPESETREKENSQVVWPAVVSSIQILEGRSPEIVISLPMYFLAEMWSI